MIDQHERLKAAREAAGYSTATAAANAMGVGIPTYINHENGTAGLSRNGERYARFFGVSFEWLMTGKGAMRAGGEAAAPDSGKNSPDIISAGNVRAAGPLDMSASPGPRDLPILGTAAGSLGRGAFQIDDPIDYIPRPAVLARVRDAYAIYVEGESMYPAHAHGDLRLVHPHRPCQIGDDVVIVARFAEHEPAEAFIKRLVKRTASTLTVEQFNPPAKIEFRTKYVERCHKVLTLNDLMGA